MPSNGPRGKRAIIAYNADFTKEEITEFLLQFGIRVMLVAKSAETKDVFILADNKTKRYWVPNTFIYKDVTPLIRLSGDIGHLFQVYAFFGGIDLNMDMREVSYDDIVAERTKYIRVLKRRIWRVTRNLG